MKKLRISTALLGVSQQVNGEALQIMYGLNTFEAKIALDPRVPHAYDHNLQPRDQGNRVKRLITRIEFTSVSLRPKHDLLLPAEVLQASILGDNLI